jgi:uncharacterized protein (TIGR03000 family)
MYSIVLMAALTSGQQSPQLFHHHGHGWAGCYGGCYGYGYGGWGGYSGPAVAYGCWGWDYGCYGGGCGGFGGMAYMPIPTPVYGGLPIVPDTTEPKKKKMKGTQEEEEISTTDRARIVIDLPPGASLYVDDRAITNVSTRKRFHTPALRPGQTYFYEVRAELTVNGERVQETRRVVVRAGQAVREDFRSVGAIATALAKARARR